MKIVAKILELNGLIHSKYSTESQLADELGWTKQRLNKITNGLKEPDLDEVEALAKKLDQSIETVAYIFLNASHQMDN